MAHFRPLGMVLFTPWGIPEWMAHLLPDQWNNVTAIARSHSPLLVVHSDTDRANPIWMGERLYRAAPQPKQLVVLHGLRHNAAYVAPIVQWWAPVITFIEDAGQGSRPEVPGGAHSIRNSRNSVQYCDPMTAYSISDLRTETGSGNHGEDSGRSANKE